MATSYFADAGNADATSGILSPSTPSSTAPRSNALQNRITAVLSASYADLEIRDALAELDARGTKNTPATRRNLRLDVQEDLIRSNGAIVSDFGLVAAQLQRIGAVVAQLQDSCGALRRHIGSAQRETGPLLDEATTLLREQAHVAQKQQLLSAVTAHFVVSDADLATLTAVSEPVDAAFFAVLARVQRIHADSRVLLATEHDRLGREILEQSSRQLDAAFQKLYRWIQREFAALDLENPHLGAALRRALRVLAERPTLFEAALEGFATEREQTLAARFYSALTGAPLGREHAGSAVSQAPAIELTAADPLRYISDMLAWAHAAAVSEREGLEVLFIGDGDELARHVESGREAEPWRRRGDAETEEGDDGEAKAPPFDGRRALADLVDRVLAAVFQQLKQRTEQVVHSHDDGPLAYQVANLVRFYMHMFTPLLGPVSPLLVDVLAPLAETAMRAFRSATREQVAALQVDPTLLLLPTDAHKPVDLSPPPFLLSALATLRILMQSHDAATPHLSAVERAETFTPVLTEALDPYLALIETRAPLPDLPTSSSLTTTDSTPPPPPPPPHAAILHTNTLTAIRSTLLTRPFTASRARDLTDAKLASLATYLSSATQAWLRATSGLAGLFVRARTAEDLLLHHEREPEWLARAAEKLDAFLPGAAEDARGVFLRGLGRGGEGFGEEEWGEEEEDGGFVGSFGGRDGFRRKVVDDAVEAFCGEFEKFEEVLVQAEGVRRKRMGSGSKGGKKGKGEEGESEEEEDEGSLREVFPRTGDEIRVLLS